MIKIYAHKIEHYPKNRHSFETMIILLKANKNKSYSLFSSHFSIKGQNQEKN